MKSLKRSVSEHTFLFIAVAISVYFGVHGYYFLADPGKWNWPWGLALSTILLIEIIWLNIFRPKTYGKGVNLVAGTVAMAFCVFLPALSSWSDFQKVEKAAAITIEMGQPEYYSDNVIPALEDELEALEVRISPRIKELDRRLELGTKEYSREVLKDGSVRIYTGIQAASWIPRGTKEKADFRRVEALRNQIRQYRESDRDDKNIFEANRVAQVSKIAGLSADVDNGRMSFAFKGILIISLGLFSLYYMYSYSNPGVDGEGPEEELSVSGIPPFDFEKFADMKPIDLEPKKKPVVLSKDKKFILDRYPDAEGVISGDKKVVNITLPTGEILGTSPIAPHAWRIARKTVENFEKFKEEEER